MGDYYLYHLSHFFEILTGIYFGCFAIFAFFEKEMYYEINEKLERQKNKLAVIDSIINQYYLLVQPRNGRQSIDKALSWWYSGLLASIGRNTYNSIGIKLSRIKSKYIGKLYTPMFFFAGCFCLTLILITPFEKEYHINTYITLYAISAIMFYTWLLVWFRDMINRIDYLVLTYINIVIAIFMAAASIAAIFYCSLHNITLFSISYSEDNIWPTIMLVAILLFPILNFSSYYFTILWQWAGSHIISRALLKRYNRIAMTEMENFRLKDIDLGE